MMDIDKAVKRIEKAITKIGKSTKAAKKEKKQQVLDRNEEAKVACEEAIELLGEPEPVPPPVGEVPLTGFWVQELLGWERGQISDAIESAAGLGHGAFAFIGPLIYREAFTSHYLQGNDLSKARHLEEVVEICREIIEAGMVPIIYGHCWPEFRQDRPNTMLHSLKYDGVAIPFDDYRGWRNEARLGCLRLWSDMTNLLADEGLLTKVWLVDGVEPHGGSQQPGPPANEYQTDIWGDTPDGMKMFQYAGHAGQTDLPNEVHSNPGDSSDGIGRQADGGYATDGWGHGGDKVWPDAGRAFAALPQGSEKDVVAWFKKEWTVTADAGCAFYLCLFTGDWDHSKRPPEGEPQSPLYRQFDVQPWDAISKGLQEAAAEYQPPADGVDEIDVSQIEWLHTDVGGWPTTSTVLSVKADPGEVCIDHTMKGQWETDSDGLEGNPWVVAFINGQWYAATYEWLRSGQVCKALNVPEDHPDTAHAIGPHTKQQPVLDWVPQKGEQVGFFVSGLARSGTPGSHERSNIVVIDWPY